MTRIQAIGAVLVGVTALLACNRDRSREGEPGTTTVTGATPTIGNDVAVSRIVGARCAREIACNNVGRDKRYDSSDVCSQKIRDDMRDDLSTRECPSGIAARELDACLAAIKAANCDNAIDKIERLFACRTSELCVKSAAR